MIQLATDPTASRMSYRPAANDGKSTRDETPVGPQPAIPGRSSVGMRRAPRIMKDARAQPTPLAR